MLCSLENPDIMEECALILRVKVWSKQTMVQRYVPPKCWASSEWHGLTTQKVILFVIIDVSTSIPKLVSSRLPARACKGTKIASQSLKLYRLVMLFFFFCISGVELVDVGVVTVVSGLCCRLQYRYFGKYFRTSANYTRCLAQLYQNQLCGLFYRYREDCCGLWESSLHIWTNTTYP
jgi:hypothetical protein